MSTRVLFVGGPKDGVRMVMESTPAVLRVHEMLPAPVTPCDGSPARETAKAHQYRFVAIGIGAMYVHDSVPDVLLALVNGYRDPGVEVIGADGIRRGRPSDFPGWGF